MGSQSDRIGDLVEGGRESHLSSCKHQGEAKRGHSHKAAGQPASQGEHCHWNLAMLAP